MIVKINGNPIEIDLSKVSNLNVKDAYTAYYDFLQTPVDVHLTYGSTQLFNGNINPIHTVVQASHDLATMIQNIF